MSRGRSIGERRAISQQLSQTEFSTPGQVVAWLVAVQGQDYAGAKWSIGVRLTGSTDASIESALAGGELIRTWALRGTLHIVAAPDVHWLLALLGPHIIARNARRYRQLQLDERTLARSNTILARALRDGEQLNRRELFSILERSGISTRGQRGVHMLQRASLDALICQGPAPRNNPIFLSLDRMPRGPEPARDQALAELARRYFSSHGPATVQDFSWWSGLAAADARTGLEAVHSALIQETIDGQVYWSAPLPEGERTAAGKAFLLPGYDEFLIAYRDRRASLEAPEYDRRVGGGGMLPGTIMAKGRVFGMWTRTLRKDRVDVAVEPFAPLTDGQRRAASAAARRYGQFLGLKAELE